MPALLPPLFSRRPALQPAASAPIAAPGTSFRVFQPITPSRRGSSLAAPAPSAGAQLRGPGAVHVAWVALLVAVAAALIACDVWGLHPWNRNVAHVAQVAQVDRKGQEASQVRHQEAGAGGVSRGDGGTRDSGGGERIPNSGGGDTSTSSASNGGYSNGGDRSGDSSGAVEYRGAPWKADVGRWLLACSDQLTPVTVGEALFWRACPGNCSGNGVCNHELGECRCRHGFSAPWMASICPTHCNTSAALCFCANGTRFPHRPINHPCGFVFRNHDFVYSEVDTDLLFHTHTGYCNADPRVGFQRDYTGCGVCDVDGFLGPFCDVRVESFCLNQCSLHGSCHRGYCECSYGFFGIDCSVPSAFTPRALFTHPSASLQLDSAPADVASTAVNAPLAGTDGGGGSRSSAGVPYDPTATPGDAAGSIPPGVVRRRVLHGAGREGTHHGLQAPLGAAPSAEARKIRAYCTTRLYGMRNETLYNHFQLYGMEVAVLESLLASPHRTTNASAADYFFVPVMGGCITARADDSPATSMQVYVWAFAVCHGFAWDARACNTAWADDHTPTPTSSPHRASSRTGGRISQRTTTSEPWSTSDLPTPTGTEWTAATTSGPSPGMKGPAVHQGIMLSHWANTMAAHNHSITHLCCSLDHLYHPLLQTFPWDEGACSAPKDVFRGIMLSHWGNTMAAHNHSTTAYLLDSWHDIPPALRGRHPCFDPLKDVVMPAFKPPNAEHLRGRLWLNPVEQRPRLFFFGGNLGLNFSNGRPEANYSMGIRQRVAVYFASQPNRHGNVGLLSHPDVLVLPGSVPDYAQQLSQARFCGVFPGDGFSARMEDSLLHGCIPCIIQDGIELPFENFLDYPSFTVRIPEADIPNLITILSSFSSRQVRAMQRAASLVWMRWFYRSAVLLEVGRQRAQGKVVGEWVADLEGMEGDDAVDTLLQRQSGPRVPLTSSFLHRLSPGFAGSPRLLRVSRPVGSPCRAAKAGGGSGEDRGDAQCDGNSNASSGAGGSFFKAKSLDGVVEDIKDEFRTDVRDAQILLAAIRAAVIGAVENIFGSAREQAAAVKRRGLPKLLSAKRWHQVDQWKNPQSWTVLRWAVAALYLAATVVFCRAAGRTVAARLASRPASVERFLEFAIPEPTPENVRLVREQRWRAHAPPGLSVVKWRMDRDGRWEKDPSFVGETAWQHEGDLDRSSATGLLTRGSDAVVVWWRATFQGPVEEASSLYEYMYDWDPIQNQQEEERRVDSIPPCQLIFSSCQPVFPSFPSPSSQLRVCAPLGSDSGAAGGGDGLKAPLNAASSFPPAYPLLSAPAHPLLLPTPHATLYPSYEYVYDWDLIQAQQEEEMARRARGEGEADSPAVWLQRRWWKYRPGMPYVWLLHKIQTNEVDAAVFTADMRRLYVTMKEGFPAEFKVDIPIDPFLYPSLLLKGVNVDMLPRSRLFFLRGVAALLPSLLLLGGIGAAQIVFKRRVDEKIHDYIYMDRSQLLLPEDVHREGQRSAYDDVVMADDIWEVLEEVMAYMRDPMLYHSQGIKLPRGILISGPPGTGKTLLARSIARECGLPFVFTSGAEFVDSTSESGLDKVFNIFFTARANAPSFLFVDEIDALAGKSVLKDPERRDVYEEFLAELDGEEEHTDVDRFSLRQAVILIAATNRPDELDEGLTKAGRIDREIHVGLPSEEQRIAIFGVHSRNRLLAPSVDFSKVTFRTIGFSGADIRNLVNEAGIMAVRSGAVFLWGRHSQSGERGVMAVRRGHTVIEQGDVVAALDKQLFESLGISMTDDEQQRLFAKVPAEVRRVLAVHEAGHVLLSHLFPCFDWHAFTHILPGGQERALSVFYPRQEMLLKGSTSIGYLHMQMVVAHGGMCAERLVFGDDHVTDNGQDDLMKLSQIAREIASSHANPRFGLMPVTMHPIMEPPGFPDEVELIPSSWSRPGTQVAAMSVEMSEIFTREVTWNIELTERMAMDALRRNRAILDKLTDHLVEHFRISGLEAGEIVYSMQPQMLPDLLEPETETEAAQEDADTATPPDWNPEQPGRYQYLDIYPAPLHRC
ncbi:unnamed protein product [Closterium sp. Yama58-4]|nr:unnamed protein product [Closterium sp. Yama58-4]